MSSTKLTAELEPLPNYGLLMTVADFVSMVRRGCLIDYDGDGVLATADACSEIIVRPSDVTERGLDARGFTHVVWFNR